MIFTPQQFTTSSLLYSSAGNAICKILAATFSNADAGEAIRRHVSCDGDYLVIDNHQYDLNKFHQIYVIGAGKACYPMAISLDKILKGRITRGLVITKDGYVVPGKTSTINKIKIIEANHPIPDGRNLAAGEELLSIMKDLRNDDLVIVLLSGGGSSLLMKPIHGISLEDIQSVTSLLLKCGAKIQEINTVRKHLDVFKGGGLAHSLYPATIICLILSDVVGDDLAMIASGPTVPDHTTYSDVWSTLSKYKLLEQIPASVIERITAGMDGKIPENPKPGDQIFNNVINIIVGNNHDVAISAIQEAEAFGFTSKLMTASLQGEASLIGASIVQQVKNIFSLNPSLSRPACFIAGGETTVTVKGSGIGGRNQELVLGAVKNLSGSGEMILISVATDGGDGPTDAAGAVATQETYARGFQMGLDPRVFLDQNDSYHYFDQLGDLIKTGPTLTNVNDLVFIFVL